MDAAITRINHRAADLAVLSDAGTANHGATEEAAGPLLHIVPTRAPAKADAAMTPHPLQHMYCVLRCNRWGTYVRWSHRTLSRNPKPADTTSWWGPLVLDPNVEHTGIASVHDICPVDIAEALETARCVKALPVHLRKAMEQEHVIRGTQQQKARALGIDRTTFWRHCERSYVLLLDCFLAAASDLELESFPFE